ncbi:MAG: TraV family lipoprotein [Methylococcales bacterium]
MKYIFIIFGFIILNGCSTKYTCGDFPGGGCQPVSTAYDKTNGSLDDYRGDFYSGSKGQTEARSVDRYSSDDDYDGDEEGAGVVINITPGKRSLSTINPGNPILSKPITLRILLNQWEDKDHDLNGGGFIFIKLQDSKWVIN